MATKNNAKTDLIKEQSRKLKILGDLLHKTQELGFQVRREKLKQGHGWRCMSGSCVLKGQKILFLDSKTSLDEQVHFLSSWLAGGASVDGPEPTADLSAKAA